MHTVRGWLLYGTKRIRRAIIGGFTSRNSAMYVFPFPVKIWKQKREKMWMTRVYKHGRLWKTTLWKEGWKWEQCGQQQRPWQRWWQWRRQEDEQCCCPLHCGQQQKNKTFIFDTLVFFGNPEKCLRGLRKGFVHTIARQQLCRLCLNCSATCESCLGLHEVQSIPRSRFFHTKAKLFLHKKPTQEIKTSTKDLRCQNSHW